MSNWSWFTIKAIVIPLIPVWTGAIVRYMCLGEFSWHIVGVADLSVSLALLFLLLGTSAGRILDSQTRYSVSSLCSFFALVFFLFFVLAVLFDTLNASQRGQFVRDVQESISTGQTVDNSFLTAHPNSDGTAYSKMLDRGRTIELIVLLIALPLIYYLRYKYKLEA